MNTTSRFVLAVRRSESSAFFGSFGSLGRRLARPLVAGLALAAVATVGRAELLVLQTGGSGSGSPMVWRFDHATGTPIATFSYENEGFTAMTVSPFNEVFVTTNILGSYSVYRFGRTGTYLGTVAGGEQADNQAVLRGPDGSLYSVCRTGTSPTSPGGDKFIGRHGDGGTTVFIANGTGGMSQPTWMIRGPDGDLYVADSGVGILRWDPLESTCRHASLSIL